MKEGIEKVCIENESAAIILRPCNWQATGHPSISKEQPDLLSANVNIVQASTVTDDRRRTETRSVKTIDDLHAELKKIGFNINRSTLYLWILPRKCEIVPVKLLRSDSSLR